MMTTEVILNTFAIIGAIVGFIALHSSFLLAKTKRSYVTWLYPIVVVVCIMVAVKNVDAIQGLPIEGKPVEQFEYMGHVEDNGLVIVTLRIDTTVKTYRWSPTQEEKEALRQGADGKDKGQAVGIELIPGEPPKVELLRLDQLAPKEGY